MKAVKPVFTLAQAQAVRIAISWAEETEDARLCRTLENAMRQLNIAQREAEGS